MIFHSNTYLLEYHKEKPFQANTKALGW